jgi:hypothetical protein
MKKVRILRFDGFGRKGHTEIGAFVGIALGATPSILKY